MKFRGLIIFVGAVFGVCGVCFGLENPNVGSPVGSGTAPVSSSQSGLHRSPVFNPSIGNDIVTGNVGGGKHFRGVVPYNSMTDFGGNLNTGTVDSFLRQSAGGSYSGQYESFYSPTGSVTGLNREGMVMTAPRASTSFIQNDFALRPAQKPAGMEINIPSLNRIRVRPLTMSTEEIEKYIESQLAEKGVKPFDAIQLDALEKSREKLREEKEVEIVLEEGEGESLEGKMKEWELMRETKEERRVEREEEIKEGEPVDVYEQMQEEIKKYQEEYLERFVEGKEQEAQAAAEAEAEAEKEEEDAGLRTPREAEAASEKRLRERAARDEEKIGQLPDHEELQAMVDETNLSAARASGILTSRKSFATFSDDKFNHYMRAAETYLRDGKYYRAADAYTVAMAYDIENPLSYAGKGHALFAAGEYMSSALYIARALERFAGYALVKVDLDYMLGSRDTLDKRVGDLEKWKDVSGAGEMKFLLAYIYHQMGRGELARERITEAASEMPESKAVAVLKAVIEAE